MSQLKVKFTGLETIKTIIGQKNPICILGISMGQSYHEADKLHSIIEGINDEGFSKCIIVLGDTLQRYNYQIQGKSKEEAYQEAILASVTWKSNNLEIIQKLQIPYEIYSWNDWILAEENDPDNDISYLKFNSNFENKLKFVQHLYIENAEYRDAIDVATSQIFLSKKNSSGCNIEKKEAEALVKKYIEEELAVIILWENKFKNSIFIYPNSIGKSPQKACECYKQLIASIEGDFKLYIGDILFFSIHEQPQKKLKSDKKNDKILSVQNKQSSKGFANSFPEANSLQFFQSSRDIAALNKEENKFLSPFKKELISTVLQASMMILPKNFSQLEIKQLEEFTAKIIYTISTLPVENTTSPSVNHLSNNC